MEMTGGEAVAAAPETLGSGTCSAWSACVPRVPGHQHGRVRIRFRGAIESGHPALLDIDLLSLSPLPGPRPTTRVDAGLARVLPEIAAWAATLPAGILRLDPWLVPVRGED